MCQIDKRFAGEGRVAESIGPDDCTRVTAIWTAWIVIHFAREIIRKKDEKQEENCELIINEMQ